MTSGHGAALDERRGLARSEPCSYSVDDTVRDDALSGRQADMPHLPAHCPFGDGEGRGRRVRPARSPYRESGAPVHPESNCRDRPLAHAPDAEIRRRCLENPAHFRRGFLADAANGGERVG